MRFEYIVQADHAAGKQRDYHSKRAGQGMERQTRVCTLHSPGRPLWGCTSLQASTCTVRYPMQKLRRKDPLRHSERRIIQVSKSEAREREREYPQLTQLGN